MRPEMASSHPFPSENVLFVFFLSFEVSLESFYKLYSFLGVSIHDTFSANNMIFCGGLYDHGWPNT